MSGLFMNAEKSKIYLGGVKAEEKGSTLAASGMREGELPVKYLGVPLHQ